MSARAGCVALRCDSITVRNYSTYYVIPYRYVLVSAAVEEGGFKV